MATILILEDYEPLRALYHRFLSNAGYAVIQAATCQQAIDYLQVKTPDVVLLDMSLPDGNGFSVVQYIARVPRFKDAQLVAVTGNDRYQRLAEAYGIEYFLYKPISMPMLLTLMQRLTAPESCAAMAC